MLTAFFAGMLLVSAVSPADLQKPVVKAPVMRDYLVPQTVEELAAQSDAVVIGQLGDLRDVSKGAESSKARTEYTLRVTKRFKGVGVGDIAVCRGVGTVEQQDRRVRVYEPNFPDFQKGEVYLLFLRWDAENACFWPGAGPMSVARIENGLAKPRGGPLANLRDLKGAALEERLMEAVRR